MSPSPRISLVIPTFNRSSLVGEAIRSVLSQSFSDLELIVVDDGSSDNTADVVAALAVDKRLSYYRQENGGRSAARNAGLSVARGEFIGFLDSDDSLLPDALSEHLTVLASLPDVGMTIGGYSITNDAGATLGDRRPWESGGSLDLRGWLFDCYGMPGTVLHRRSWLDRVGGFDSTCEIAEDWDLYLRLAAKNCPMAWVKHVTCRYRRHEGNSDRELDAHLLGSIATLEKLFARPDLAESVRVMKSRALAWTNLHHARKGLQHNQLHFARARIDDALVAGWPMTSIDRIQAAEFLLTPVGGHHSRSTSQDISLIVDRLKLRPSELRKAVARLKMTEFFLAARRENWPAAKRSLRDGILADPRWLANRGVLRLGLRAFIHDNLEISSHVF